LSRHEAWHPIGVFGDLSDAGIVVRIKAMRRCSDATSGAGTSRALMHIAGWGPIVPSLWLHLVQAAINGACRQFLFHRLSDVGPTFAAPVLVGRHPKSYQEASCVRQGTDVPLGRSRLKCDSVTEVGQAFEEAIRLLGLGAAVEVPGAEVLISGTVLEHVINGRENLQEPWVKLVFGLTRTKERPTSVPTDAAAV
jgi:hypothetical protein